MSFRDTTGEPVDPLADTARETDHMRSLARQILELAEGEELSPGMVRRGLTSLTKLYAVQHERGQRDSPFDLPQDMPPTAALILVTAALEAVNVEPFELGMWKAFSGGPRP